MAWVTLGIAGIFEVVWATCMKYSEGFTKLSWSLLTFAGMAVSFFLLARATKTLPLGTAYAVWRSRRPDTYDYSASASASMRCCRS